MGRKKATKPEPYTGPKEIEHGMNATAAFIDKYKPQGWSAAELARRCRLSPGAISRRISSGQTPGEGTILLKFIDRLLSSGQRELVDSVTFAGDPLEADKRKDMKLTREERDMAEKLLALMEEHEEQIDPRHQDLNEKADALAHIRALNRIFFSREARIADITKNGSTTTPEEKQG